MFNFFKKPIGSFIGIDIGTTGIRIVQLGMKDGVIKLDNYASIETKDYLEILGSGSKFTSIKLSDSKIASDLGKIISGAGIMSKKVAMSVPTSSTFSSIMSMPKIPEDEIASAVNFEARQYIPIPLDEVIFDWSVIGGNGESKTNNEDDKLKILLVAIPRETANKYINVVNILNLELISLETEAFSLARSLAGKKEGAYTIIDIGNKTTSVVVVENGSVIGSHSISGTGGEEITKIISHGFNVDINRAEQLKIDVGFNTNKGSDKKVSEIMLPIVDIILSEIEKINEAYSRTSKKKIKKVILTGGTAGLPGLPEYMTEKLKTPTEKGNPWSDVSYDKILTEKLENSSPFFSVAVGLALRGFDK
ncbi:MAG: type IV pilus assembly protein PilM [Patescibacteria group bacterium]|nr:type IV pilus assembly protein PilM [Patescibacteria group bacterium]